jgi:hypothetical protein
MPNDEVRVVAYDVAGKMHRFGTTPFQPATGTRYRGGGVEHGVFPGLPLARVDRFELQYRPQHMGRFQNVSLRSGEKTDVRMEAIGVTPRTSASPAERRIARELSCDQAPLGAALVAIERAGKVAVNVRWDDFAEYQKWTASSPVTLRLTGVTPPTAVRAAIESAGGRDFTVIVSPDGRTVHVVAGAFHATYGNWGSEDPREDAD